MQRLFRRSTGKAVDRSNGSYHREGQGSSVVSPDQVPTDLYVPEVDYRSAPQAVSQIDPTSAPQVVPQRYQMSNPQQTPQVGQRSNPQDTPPRDQRSAVKVMTEDTQRPPEPGFEMGPNDVAIAVMGVTGSGKSSFVSLLADTAVQIGHNLESCTSEVGVYRCPLEADTWLYLIDTPGFDDTYKSDTDVLREVATYLGDTYANKIKLTGIIYLHRIIDPRLQGSAMKNLRMFKKLCGDNSLGSVILATTWWSKIDQQIGARREQELVRTEDFWGGMVSKGSKVFRHLGDRSSAMEIVSYLVSRRRPIILDIQTEMVDQKMTLDQTGAGKEVEADRLKQKLEFEAKLKEVQHEKEEALQERDRESADALAKFEAKYSEKLQQIESDRHRLQENLEKMTADRERELTAQRQRFEEQIAKHNQQMAEERNKLRYERDNLKPQYGYDGEFIAKKANAPELLTWSCSVEHNGCGGSFVVTRAQMMRGVLCPWCSGRRYALKMKRT